MIYEYQCPKGHVIEAHVKLSGEGTPESCTEVVPMALQLSQAEFDALLEYSCSIPTGTIPGKRWKRRTYDLTTKQPNGWIIGEYGQIIGDEIEVTWWPLVIAPFPVPQGPCGAAPLKRILSVPSPYFPGAGSWRGA